MKIEKKATSSHPMYLASVQKEIISTVIIIEVEDVNSNFNFDNNYVCLSSLSHLKKISNIFI